jgi:hypothetical protein
MEILSKSVGGFWYGAALFKGLEFIRTEQRRPLFTEKL